MHKEITFAMLSCHDLLCRVPQLNGLVQELLHGAELLGNPIVVADRLRNLQDECSL